MAHERSITYEQDGKWVNAYGPGVYQPQGTPLPGVPQFNTEAEASQAARQRSESFPGRWHGGPTGVTTSDFLRGMNPQMSPQDMGLIQMILQWLRATGQF